MYEYFNTPSKHFVMHVKGETETLAFYSSRPLGLDGPRGIERHHGIYGIDGHLAIDGLPDIRGPLVIR